VIPGVVSRCCAFAAQSRIYEHQPDPPNSYQKSERLNAENAPTDHHPQQKRASSPSRSQNFTGVGPPPSVPYLRLASTNLDGVIPIPCGKKRGEWIKSLDLCVQKVIRCTYRIWGERNVASSRRHPSTTEVVGISLRYRTKHTYYRTTATQHDKSSQSPQRVPIPWLLTVSSILF
jgi:hypothetical protein